MNKYAVRSENRTPSRGSANLEVLAGRYKFSADHVLGEGAFSTVYKGLDTADRLSRNVAIKVFNDRTSDKDFVETVEAIIHLESLDFNMELALSDPRDQRQACNKVESFKPALIGQDAGEATGEAERRERLLTMMKKCTVQNCFVKLLDYSRMLTDKGERPGRDVESGLLFMVYEMGEESLHDKLAARREEGKPLTVEELRSLQWSLVSVACALHAVGFVHLDIKPANVVCFEGVWKLIDLDSALHAHEEYAVEELTTTACYLAPELARDICDHSVQATTVSRLADVWSMGMCALETVLLQPVLEALLGLDSNWNMSGQSASDSEMLRWLCDEQSAPLINSQLREALREISAEMADLLEGMLERDPVKRLCIVECFVHPWFKPIRDQMWQAMHREAGRESRRSSSSNALSELSVPGSTGMRSIPTNSKLPAGKWMSLMSCESAVREKRRRDAKLRLKKLESDGNSPNSARRRRTRACVVM